MRRNFAHVPTRKSTSHKGENGKVLAVGGSEEYPGAIMLAGLAALRSGADLVHLCTPEKVAWAINAHTPDLVTRKMRGKVLSQQNYAAIKELTANADVLLLGNGIGLAKTTQQLCKRLAKLPLPKVIDADALKAITLDDPRNAILTPNPAEWKLLLKNSAIPPTDDGQKLRKHLQRFFANGNVLLRKGSRDLVMSAQGTQRITGGNAGMTKGGTGDVLAGIAAGLLAQGMSAQDAAVAASTYNKRIGDILRKKHKGYSYLASDMVQELNKRTMRLLPQE